jgi:hypothetical protein
MSGLKKTDNDREMFSIKVELRERLIQNKPTVNVLECFSGDGAIWNTVKKNFPDKKINILRIDMKPDKKGTYLKGDNLKFLASIDLKKFDIIDLDAYGSPFPQLNYLFKSDYSGDVVCTFIQSMAGALNKEFLYQLGYTKAMVKECPTLFNINGFDKMKAYLANQGVKRISYFSKKRKNYFSFSLKK